MLTAQNFVPIAAELWLLVAASVILVWDAYSRNPSRSLWLSQIAMAVSAAISIGFLVAGNTLYAWGGQFVSDPLANLLKAACALSTMAVLHYGVQYNRDREMHQVEFYSLALFALMGQLLMVSSNNLLLLYLGLELMSLSLYALVALRRDSVVATEASMKYFVLGAIASGFMLYGVSMLYGATGSLDIGAIYKALSTENSGAARAAAILASVFIVAGLGFKLGAVPFHMWVPDVYEGAPTTVTLLIASAPKIATVGMALRLMVEAMLPLANDWQPMFIVLGVASVALGNLFAVVQTSLKRLLAFSTISHMGFIALALAVGVVGKDTSNGIAAYGAAVFYVLTYVLTTLASFGVILWLAKAGFESDQIADLKGLNQRSPLLAMVLLIVIFSLAGVPPMVGFWAKFEVVRVMLAGGYTALAVVVVLFSLIGAFYYLRLIKAIYFDAPAENAAAQPVSTSLVLSVNAALILLLGLLPSGLLSLSVDVIKKALAS